MHNRMSIHWVNPFAKNNTLAILIYPENYREKQSRRQYPDSYFHDYPFLGTPHLTYPMYIPKANPPTKVYRHQSNVNVSSLIPEPVSRSIV